MATTEAPPRTRRRTAAPKVKVTPEDFVRVARFLDTQVLVERALELRMVGLATLSGVNLHLLGGAGIAKSLALREWAKCITNARYFEKPLNPTLTPDAVIGGYDMPRYAKTGEFVRKVDGYAPTAHVVFLDEWFRANGAMLDALLPLANTEERQAEHNGGMMKCPTVVLVSASNTLPDPDNVQSVALVDRITLMLEVKDVKADESFKEVFRRHHDRRQADRAGVTTRETMTLEQVLDAQRQVDAVTLSPEFLDAAADLRRRTKDEGLAVSPRRWMELGRVARANAWMAGRDYLVAEDLSVTEHGMWRDPAHAPLAHKLCMPFHGRYEREATEKRIEAEKAFAEIAGIRAAVEGTPPTERLPEDVLRVGMAATRAIDHLKGEVDELLVEADKEKRDAASLRDLANELLTTQGWLFNNSFATKYRP